MNKQNMSSISYSQKFFHLSIAMTSIPERKKINLQSPTSTKFLSQGTEKAHYLAGVLLISGITYREYTVVTKKIKKTIIKMVKPMLGLWMMISDARSNDCECV